ncbi:methylated-DNA--[protein]-cysteine S-methyltransferase [Halorubrum sp. GN11_10-6_MGM]|uniref:MGMT family protein n=1 Tax=Halorubrum sp. GN11_10-6_MGM TaxID=2518112 RepID=UPI0010F86078|nr:MGMT family protein [Halorubrum sp. GN11_10-6_MGM]TKX75155.1 methylated-DNA--[protein]-cysteine S-methyltransferase [Halorubrum sp. GN11_10-6_MGM]
MSLSGTSGVYARKFGAIDRAVQVGFAGGRVISVSFPAEPPADAEGDHDLLDRVDAYLGGERDEFAEVALGLTVPTDQREVLEALRSLPYGEEVSVSRLTRLSGFDPDDADDLETVTAALDDNPIPVLLPDHRVSGGPYATPGDVRSALRRIEGI